MKKQPAGLKPEILDFLNEGIHIVNEQGITVFYNKKMAEMESMEVEAVLGLPLLESFPGLSLESSTLLRVLSGAESILNQEQSYFNKYGQKITTLNSTYPLRLAGNKIWALEVAQDITELKNLYLKLNQLQEKLFTRKRSGSQVTSYTLEDIRGSSPEIKQVLKTARQAAVNDSPVLLIGATGTGKELFAQGIHAASPRRNSPFVAQNCAALPDSLLEGILFGTRRGGFTGAVDRKGLFQQASGGTLLLDEIDSLSAALQAKLLRVLQEGKVRPVGGREEIEVDVRIIATMTVSPLKAIRNGSLREDLFYRLAVILIKLPLLKERRRDILSLTEFFIKEYNRKFNLEVQGISERLQQIFLEYSWPGNVRQLKHVIEGAMNLIDRENIIGEEQVDFHLLEIPETTREQEAPFETERMGKKLNNPGEDFDRHPVEENTTLPELLNSWEKNYIRATLARFNGNVSRAAGELGLSRQSLQYRIKKYGIDN